MRARHGFRLIVCRDKANNDADFDDVVIAASLHYLLCRRIFIEDQFIVEYCSNPDAQYKYNNGSWLQLHTAVQKSLEVSHAKMPACSVGIFYIARGSKELFQD